MAATILPPSPAAALKRSPSVTARTKRSLPICRAAAVACGSPGCITDTSLMTFWLGVSVTCSQRLASACVASVAAQVPYSSAEIPTPATDHSLVQDADDFLSLRRERKAKGE